MQATQRLLKHIAHKVGKFTRTGLPLCLTTLALTALVACSGETGPDPTATDAPPTATAAPVSSATPGGESSPGPITPQATQPAPDPVATVAPTAAATPTPTATATPSRAPTPTPAPSGRDPYADGQPPRFLWHYPDPPRGLTARGVSGDSVILEWEPTHGAAGYDVLYYAYSETPTPDELANAEEHPIFNSAFASTGDLFTPETSREIWDLDCEQTYLFEVRALGGGIYIDTVYPARKDYGPPSRVIISPCDAGPAMSESHTGLCPDGGDDCLDRSRHWPSFQAVYSYFHPESWTHECADGAYYESRRRSSTSTTEAPSTTGQR